MLDYEFYQVKEENDFIEYEKGLFESFYLKDPSGWVANNYLKIDDCRLKSKIPYNDQLIYATKKNNNIIMAMAVNINSNNKMQFEEMGFSINEDERKLKICEGLNFFIKSGDIKCLKLNIVL